MESSAICFGPPPFNSLVVLSSSVKEKGILQKKKWQNVNCQELGERSISARYQSKKCKLDKGELEIQHYTPPTSV